MAGNGCLKHYQATAENDRTQPRVPWRICPVFSNPYWPRNTDVNWPKSFRIIAVLTLVHGLDSTDIKSNSFRITLYYECNIIFSTKIRSSPAIIKTQTTEKNILLSLAIGNITFQNIFISFQSCYQFNA